MRKKRKYIMFSAISMLLFFIIAEIVFRVYLSFSPFSTTREYHHTLGWANVPEQKFNYTHPDIGDVMYSTNAYGFRKWGDIHSTQKKVLFIGDSYTQAKQVSDGYAYYDVVDSVLTSAEVFAYGCGGYGTLQEMMIVDSFYHLIQPDLIVWQFCYNDFINNNIVLEKNGSINNYLMRKPYWIDGHVEYLFPGNVCTALLCEKSKLFRMMLLKYYHLQHRFWGSIENEPQLIAKESGVTAEIYSMIASKYPQSVVFTANATYGYESIQKTLNKANLPFITSVHEELEKAYSKGVKIDFSPDDWHWNKEGHRIVGEVLAKEINALLFPSTHSPNPAETENEHLHPEEAANQ